MQGLDTTPLMQISRTIMRGHFKTLIGTELIFKDVSGTSPYSPYLIYYANTFIFFEEETDPDVSQPNNQRGNIRYFTKTDRRIQFREVELKPKSGYSSSQEQQKQQGQRVAAQAPLSTSKRKFSSMALESLLSGSTASSAGDPLGISDTVIGVQGEVPHAHEEARTEGDALQSREAIAATSDAARINEADGRAMDVDQ